MNDPRMNRLALSIEHTQQILVAADGTTTRGYETHIREYVGMLESGLMARLSNAAYKTLHALALRARILGDPRRPGAEKEFHELVRLGIVLPEDKGLLFCFPSRERLMRDTGIGSVHTIDAALDELAALQIVKRITPAQPRLTRGLFGSNVYLIHPESFIGKFEAGDGEQKALSERFVKDDGEQKPLSEHPAQGTGSSGRDSADGTLKSTNHQHQKEDMEIIAQHFAASIGIERYVPSEKEQRKIAALLAEGYTVEQISMGIKRAFERATQTGRQIRSIAYCIPAVREVQTTLRGVPAVQATERKAELGSPQPNTVPGQPQTVIRPNPEHETKNDLAKLSGGDTELRDLLEIVQERNPGRTLQKSDVRTWLAVAEKFRDLATARNTSPIGLVMQAVLKAIGSHSDRAGYLAPRLVEIILEDWERKQERRQFAQTEDPAVPVPNAERRSPHPSSQPLPMIQTDDGLLDPAQIWDMALKELQGQLTRATFDTWLRATFIADAQNGDAPTLVIGTRHPYGVDWLEHRLQETIQRTLVGIVGRHVNVKYAHVK